MADIFSSFLYFRSLTTNYNSPLFLPPKQYYFSSSLHSHNSRFSRTRRRRPPLHLLLPLKLSQLEASASEIVVISTHEHSDGSVLFRFGDPSEIRQNVEVEESKIVNEEVEEEGSSLVMVIEGEDETNVTVSSLTETCDSVDSIVSSSNTLIAVEGERLHSEKSLTATIDLEVPVSVPDDKVGDISSPDLEIELIDNVDGLKKVDKDLTSDKEIGGVSSPDLELKHIENVEGYLTSEREMDGVSSPDLKMKHIENVDCLKEEEQDLISSKETRGISSPDLEIKQIENLERDLTSNKETRGISSPDLEIKQVENAERDVTSNKERRSISSPDLEITQIENVERDVTSNKETRSTSSPDLEITQTENVERDLTSNKELGSVSSPDFDIKQVENVDGLNEDKKETSKEEMGDVSSLEIKPIENVDGQNEEGKNAISDEEMGGVSSPPLETTEIDNVEGLNEEDMDICSVEASIPDGSSLIENTKVEVYYDESLGETSNVTCASNEMEITSIPGIDVGQQTANVKQCPNTEDVGSPADVSILDQSYELVDDIITEALLEKESDDISSADIDADQTRRVGGSLNEVCEDSLVDASVHDKSSEMDGTLAVVLLENENDGDLSTSDIEIEATGKNVDEGTNEAYGDSLVDERSEILNTTTAALTEKEAIEIASPPYEDSLVDASEVVYGISEVVLLEKEIDGNTPASDVEIEPTENVEEGINEEHGNFTMNRRSEVLNYTTAALPEKEAAEITSVPFEDSLVDASVVEESSEVENGISTVVLLDEETVGNTSTSDLEIKPTVNVEENEECYKSPVDAGAEGSNNTIEALSEKETADITATDIDVEHNGSVEQGLGEILEEPDSLENFVTPKEVSVKETADTIASVALKMDPVVPISMLDTEAAVVTNVVPICELENAKIHDEKVVDNIDSFDDNLVSPSSDSEPAMGFYKESEVLNLEAEMKSLAPEASSGIETDNIMAVEMQNVLRNDCESDTYGGEDNSPTTESAMTWSIRSEEQASGYGRGIQNEAGRYASEKYVALLLAVSPQLEADSMLEEEIDSETVEASNEYDESEKQTMGDVLTEAAVHKTTAPEFAESTIPSQEVSTITTDFILSSGASLLPHPSKVLTGGEDAYFIANETWLGIADGVSQWSLEGTMPGVYAQELIKTCEKLVSDCSGNSINNPLELLNLSVAQTHSPGSSTVLIARFNGQALHVANVGDLGFIVLRHGAVYKRSSPMHHAFSLPLHIERGDDPSSLAQLYRVDLEEEDIIVIATDGLLDNLYDQEILLITMKSLSHGKTPEEIAEILAKKAQEVGRSASGRSPFADEAQAAGFPGFSGGKLDDVAVIVSLVQRR